MNVAMQYFNISMNLLCYVFIILHIITLITILIPCIHNYLDLLAVLLISNNYSPLEFLEDFLVLGSVEMLLLLIFLLRSQGFAPGSEPSMSNLAADILSLSRRSSSRLVRATDTSAR